MHLVKLVVLGAPGVGKTSLIEQFLENNFRGSHFATRIDPNENSYDFTVIINEGLFQVKIIDMPMIHYFPGNAFYEWTDYRGCALRSANGYLLLFDLTLPGTFQYVKVIRDQLFESRNMQNVPVYVVGNKADLCTSVLNTMRGGHHHHHHSHHSHHDQDLTPAFKELAGLVKKQWKSSYSECSAKYNWRVIPIFRDIFKAIESNQFKALEKEGPRDDHRDHRESLKISLGTGTALSLTGAHRPANPLSRTSNNSNTRENRTSCHIL